MKKINKDPGKYSKVLFYQKTRFFSVISKSSKKTIQYFKKELLLLL